MTNVKFLVFGLLLVIWPKGVNGILLMICFLIFEAGVYVNYTATQRNQIAIILSCLSLNFLPFLILTDKKPFVQILGKVIGEKVGKEILNVLSDIQENNPKGFNLVVGAVVAGSVMYGTYNVGTGINNSLIDNFYLNEAVARHTLLTDQLSDFVTLKKSCPIEALPRDLDDLIVETAKQKQTWAEIKYNWEIKKWS